MKWPSKIRNCRHNFFGDIYTHNNREIVPVDNSISITSSTNIRAQWTDYNTKITIKV